MNLISIHQPQYLPWFFFYQKILDSNKFVFLDNVNFQKNGLHNRNKIKTKDGDLWLTVPVIKSSGLHINEIKIDNKQEWIKKHLKTIDESYGKSSFYKKYKNEFCDIYEKDYKNLSELNISLIKFFLRLMEIDVPIYLSSEMNIHENGSSLLLEICKKLNADCYLSGPGGVNYLNQNIFLKDNVKIKYLQKKTILPYDQFHRHINYMPNLSMLDFLFCVGEKWKDYIR